MISYETITDAINDLKTRGYMIDFNRGLKAVNSHESSFALSPGKFGIIVAYRFEGDTDPDDEAVVYAIEARDGYKGVLINGYGISGLMSSTKK